MWAPIFICRFYSTHYFKIRLFLVVSSEPCRFPGKRTPTSLALIKSQQLICFCNRKCLPKHSWLVNRAQYNAISADIVPLQPQQHVPCSLLPSNSIVYIIRLDTTASSIHTSCYIEN